MSVTTTMKKPVAGGMPSFLKTGSAAKAALQKADTEAQLAQEQAGKLWRFRMAPGEETTITFLDGELDDDGMLNIPLFEEHTVFLNGKWQNFMCTADHEPCPICQGGDKPSLVGIMTVLDHSIYKVETGKNAGKVYQDRKKLFLAKRNTLRQLTKTATKRGGLTGAVFEASRMGEKSPAVGELFEFVEKLSPQAIEEKYGEGSSQPADYSKELVYLTASQLLELGVGKSVKTVGMAYSDKKAIDTSNLEDEL